MQKSCILTDVSEGRNSQVENRSQAAKDRTSDTFAETLRNKQEKWNGQSWVKSALGDLLGLPQIWQKKDNQLDAPIQDYKMYGEHRQKLAGSRGMLYVKGSVVERPVDKPQQVLRSAAQAEITGLYRKKIVLDLHPNNKTRMATLSVL